MQKEAYDCELLIQEVIRLRQTQKRLGGRKLFFLLQDFMRSHGISMGRDAFFDLLRDHQLLVRNRRSSKPRTTFSYHRYNKHPNLIKGLTPLKPSRLWVSDITYIQMKEKSCYLSLITDAYSRKIVGYCLSKSLSSWGCLEALKMALSDNEIDEHLIHHSDRGVQYCCNEYVDMLQKNKVSISMTQNGNPLDNAMAERVNGILKNELLEPVYECFNDALNAVSVAVSTYNNARPHLSLNMLTPAQAHQMQGEIKRCWKNYWPPKKEQEASAEVAA